MPRITQALVAIAVVLSFTPPASAQYLPENASFWWMNTDDGITHYVVEVGDDPDPARTFIVLHGGYGAEHSYLINMVLPLSDDFRFVLYDQRGSLRTPAPDSTLTFENFIGDLDTLREELGLEKVNLIGHSNGANIVLDYLGTHPDRTNGVILIGAPISFVHTDAFDVEDGFADVIQRYSAEVAAHERAATEQIEAMQKELGLLDLEGLSDREVSFRRRVEWAGRHTASAANWRTAQSAFFNPRVIEHLQNNVSPEAWRARTLRKSTAFVNATVPIRVILGEVDYVDPKGIAWGALMEHTPDGRLTILEGAGHHPWVDRADAFTQALRADLEELAGGG